MRVYRDDQRFLTFRINALLWAIAALFLLLAGSFWFVQGVQAEKYRNLSEANALREVVTPAKRGLILDRNGKILADNQPSYSLALLKPLAKGDAVHRAKLVRFLSAVLGTTTDDVESRLAHPLQIGDDLSLAQVAEIQAQSVEFPELTVNPVQRRNYPYGTMASHVMGFIGEATEKDLAARRDLRPGDLVGKRGVELVYDEYLRGRDGAQYWEYDSHGRRLAEYRPARKEAAAGDNVYLTIDFDLQRRAEQYFIANELVGAAVVMDPRNGEILAMVSSPALNPNTYSKRFTSDVWRTIVSNPFKIELNRAIQGTYSPGSVFKIPMTIAGLSEGAITPSTTFECDGTAVFFGRRFRCERRSGHGRIAVADALKVSCDIFFYNTGARLGVDRIAQYAHRFGFGELTKVDLDGEKFGLVPTTQWAAEKQHRKWYPAETINVAIGQGPLAVTPLQVASMMSAIANGGTLYQPHVVRLIEHVGSDGTVDYRSSFEVRPQILHRVPLPKQALDTLRLGLWKVVNEDGGTGSNARVEGLDVSGKTGTAQVITQSGWYSTAGLPFTERDHAWFASYAPGENPQMVVVALIEHAAAHGGTGAAPLAKLLYQARFPTRSADVSSARVRTGRPHSSAGPSLAARAW